MATRLQARSTTSPTRSARIGPRGPQRQEQMSGSFRGPAVGQVSDQGFTDPVRQRQPVLPTALAADDQLTGAPVHITELQAGHLDRAQARRASSIMIAKSRLPTPLLRSQLSAAAGPRWPTALVAAGRPATHRRHGRTEPQRRDTLQVQESQRRAQLSDPALGRPDRDPPALPEQERVDGRRRPSSSLRLRRPARRAPTQQQRPVQPVRLSGIISGRKVFRRHHLQFYVVNTVYDSDGTELTKAVADE